MRRKPSMFSKNYRRELKRRRIKRLLILAVIIVLIGGAVISYDKGLILVKNYFTKDGNNSGVEHTDNNSNETDEHSEADKEAENLPGDNEEVKDNLVTFEAKLNSGKSLVITLKDENNKKVMANLQCPEGVKGSISPSMEKALILDEETQDIYIVDNGENIKNVTNPQYVATTKDVFTKDSVLQFNPSYKWVDEAAFVDDTYVAYSSELPWINGESTKYLWIVNTDDNSHRGYYSITGKTMSFGMVTFEGVTVKVDNRELVVNSQGKIVTER